MTKFLITNNDSHWFNIVFEGERLPPTNTGETYVRMHPSQMIFHENEVSEVTDAPTPKPRYRIHEVHDFIPELFAVIKDDEDSGRVVARVETREDADLVLKALNSYKP